MVERATGREMLRWLSWQLPGRTGMETIFQTRGAETEAEMAKEPKMVEGLPASKHLIPVSARYVVAAHASKWGTGKPLCGTEEGQLDRIKMPWGQEMDPRGRLRRCPECLQLAPIGDG
jgi:hypothetical protein